MKKIIILKGLPASGKSTWAKEQVRKNPGVYKRINKDDLRAMLDESKWSSDNEKFILNLRDQIITMALDRGKSVIIDDTNLHEKHYNQIKQLVEDRNVDVEVKFFDTPLEECIKRDLARPNSVGHKVIRKMYDTFLRPRETYYIDQRKPFAILVDVDGTLAKMSNRSPFDWHRVGEDEPNSRVIDLLDAFQTGRKDVKTIIVTGRDGVCQKETEDWLHNLGIKYDEFYIRPEGNTEKDSVVKERIFNENIRDRYNVLFVLDDRDQVVDMWRSKGITCLQVDYGDF